MANETTEKAGNEKKAPIKAKALAPKGKRAAKAPELRKAKPLADKPIFSFGGYDFYPEKEDNQ